MIFRKPQQIPLHLQTDNAAQTTTFQALKLLSQHVPGREMEWLPRTKVVVAKNPSDVRLPRQDPERMWVRNDVQIGRPRHLVHPHAATAREGREDTSPRRVERRCCNVDVVAVLQSAKKGFSGHGFRA